MSCWFLLTSTIVQYQRKIKLLNQIKKLRILGIWLFKCKENSRNDVKEARQVVGT